MTLFLVAILVWPGFTTDAAADDASGSIRPRFEVTTEEAFDTDTVPPYAGQHDEVYAHIDRNLDEHVRHIQRWIRQPSISPLGIGIDEMAELVRRDFVDMGFSEAELVPTDGNPGVWGYYDAGADKTLMVYMMYDVQPVDPEDWRTPPFEANLVETDKGIVLMARGATNQKGPQRAFLNALDSIIAVTGNLPVNVMITAEGEEEIGSPHYPQIVTAYEDRLKAASGVLFPMNGKSGGGSIMMNLGVKGIIYWELESTGGDWGGPKNNEIHGSYKVIVDAPALRLVQAIASMTSADGNTILVPGFYDGIIPPTAEQQRLINGMLAVWDDTGMQRSLGLDRWIDGLTGRDAILEYLYMPTLNVDGIWGGYIEAGTKTVLPHKATAKMDARLPPGLDPDATLAKVRKHLDEQGFDDVVIRKFDSYPAAHTSIDDPFVQAALAVFNKRGHEVAVRPWLGGSAPFYQFTERLELPLVFSSPGHGSGAHAPDEYMLIDPVEGSGLSGLDEVEKYYVDLVYALAGQ
jgi:acetylornithine deacetylase/succinyl-diaminopimelate desuccinylase-like protein